jgi:hypothetical protein
MRTESPDLAGPPREEARRARATDPLRTGLVSGINATAIDTADALNPPAPIGSRSQLEIYAVLVQFGDCRLRSRRRRQSAVLPEGPQYWEHRPEEGAWHAGSRS